MPLAGRKLTYKWALALCKYAGWSRHDLTIAVAVMCAESGRWTEAWHQNLDASGKVMSTDRGLFQINDVAHPKLSDVDAYQAIPNALYAHRLPWTAWAAYNSGAHKKFVPIVVVVKALGLWRTRVSHVEAQLSGFDEDHRP